MSSPTFLLATQRQFGYHNDTFKYAEYLRDRFAVTCVCWDYGFPRVEMPGVRVEYISRGGSHIARWYRYAARVRTLVRSGEFTVISMAYFRGCSVLWRVASASPLTIDVRTGSVRRGPLTRVLEDALLRWELRGYRHVTVISESLRRRLGVPAERATIVTVGGVERPVSRRDMTGIRLLYIGTLLGRNIDLTIEGFDRARQRIDPRIPMSYDLVGDGPPDDRARLRAAIARAKTAHAIRYHGRIPAQETGAFFDSCNIGVGFVPRRPWYECQPVTKVVDCLLAGMPVIATATEENRLMVTAGDGVLIDDTAEAFAQGVCTVAGQLPTYRPDEIRRRHLGHSWDQIVLQVLLPHLERVINNFEERSR